MTEHRTNADASNEPVITWVPASAPTGTAPDGAPDTVGLDADGRYPAGHPAAALPMQGPVEPAKPARPWIRTAAVTAAAVLGVAAVGGGVVAAINANNESTGTAAAAAGGPGAGGAGGGVAGAAGQPPGGMGGGGRGGAGLMGALHGEFVVSDGNGGYLTEELQTGTVSAISATSITVASVDGYTHSYVINSSTTVGNGGTAGDIASGATVTVVAKADGDVAVSISDRSAMGQGGPDGGAPGAAPGGAAGTATS